jgi:hypothetical protein
MTARYLLDLWIRLLPCFDYPPDLRLSVHRYSMRSGVTQEELTKPEAAPGWATSFS